jgi:uncharacterized protein YjdB
MTFLKTRVVSLIAVLAVLAIPTAAHAQGQPGRLMLSPFQDSIIACNLDASNCLNVVANGSNHGGSEEVSGASNPSIAQNGTIAFQAIFNTDSTCTPGGQGICWPHVFVMNADGTNVRQITFHNGNPNTGPDLGASISPDGTMVAFISNRNAFFDSNGNASYLYQIYVVNTDGTGLREVTFPIYGVAGTPQAGNPYGDVKSLAWSPDSRKLTFKESTYGGVPCGYFFSSPKECEAVATINVDGTGLTYLATYDLNEAGSAWSIDWSPDGSLIAHAHNSVNFGGPAIAIIDLSGQGRYATGLSLAQLGIQPTFGGEVCPTDRHCLHFSPDSTKLAYENNSPSDNPAFRGISTINLDGTGRTDAANFGQTLENGIWWASGSGLPAAAHLTLAPNPVEVWPGVTRQLNPTLLDAGGNLILHTASSYTTSVDYGTSGCLRIGPYGLAYYAGSGNGTGSIQSRNEGLTSNSVAFKCWSSPPCTYALTFTSETFPSIGGSDTVGVIATDNNGSACPWLSSSNAAWILITAGSSGSGNGNVSFSVAANSGSARQGTMTIAGVTFTINQDASGPPPLQSITVSPSSASTPAGLTQQFTATGHYSDGSTQDLTTSVTWSSSNTSIATISNSAGSQGLAMGVTVGGPVTITAALGSASGTAQLTVTAPLLVALAVAPANPSVPAGGTQQFTATGSYSDGSVRNITGSVTWASSNTAVATINSSGLAAAVASGVATISATQGNRSNSTTMTVITLQSLTISPLSPSIFVGSTLQFAATGHYSDGSARDLTSTVVWTSAKTSIGTITSAGLATGVGKGNTTIKAVAGALSASTTLTVKQVSLVSITVTPPTATISVGGTQQFTAIGNYDNGSTSNITNSVTWSSMPKSVASISSTGLATGLKAGSDTITAKLGNISGSAALTVN